MNFYIIILILKSGKKIWFHNKKIKTKIIFQRKLKFFRHRYFAPLKVTTILSRFLPIMYIMVHSTQTSCSAHAWVMLSLPVTMAVLGAMTALFSFFWSSARMPFLLGHISWWPPLEVAIIVFTWIVVLIIVLVAFFDVSTTSTATGFLWQGLCCLALMRIILVIIWYGRRRRCRHGFSLLNFCCCCCFTLRETDPGENTPLIFIANAAGFGWWVCASWTHRWFGGRLWSVVVMVLFTVLPMATVFFFMLVMMRTLTFTVAIILCLSFGRCTWWLPVSRVSPLRLWVSRVSPWKLTVLRASPWQLWVPRASPWRSWSWSFMSPTVVV